MITLLTAATLTAALVCSPPLVAQSNDESVDIVVSQPQSDPWAEHLSDRLERELDRGFNDQDFSGSGIVRVVFRISASGDAVDVQILDFHGSRHIVREATSAVRKLSMSIPTPDDHAAGQQYLANMVFANSGIEARKLRSDLENLERERLASIGIARTYLAIR